MPFSNRCWLTVWSRFSFAKRWLSKARVEQLGRVGCRWFGVMVDESFQFFAASLWKVLTTISRPAAFSTARMHLLRTHAVHDSHTDCTRLAQLVHKRRMNFWHTCGGFRSWLLRRQGDGMRDVTGSPICFSLGDKMPLEFFGWTPGHPQAKYDIYACLWM